MKTGHIILAVLISAVLASTATYYLGAARYDTPAAAKESRLEQIKRTGVLRCGYIIWPPVLTKDPNTGKIGGLFPDLIEEIGKQLSVKIEWTTEMASGQMFSDMALNKYDMGCMAYFVTPGRVREGSMTLPVLYWPTFLYARANDTRFENNYARANDPAVTFATMDGEFSSIGAQEFFPKASTASVPQISSSAELLSLVVSKKADLVVTEPLTYLDYLKSNPGTLHQVKGKPVFVGAASMPLPAREPDLKEAIDGTLTYLQGLGFIDKLLSKYEMPEMKFLRPVKPYLDLSGAAR
ncbi:MAG: transporter substrate-binding domain-containing protein [Alphaproteobacteria bacterium]|nr:transporter substrate-binding domain-containing protein [Alphaproteobacteria bacterium]